MQQSLVALVFGDFIKNNNIQSLNQETPYVCEIRFNKEVDGQIVSFTLPRISYGINDDICYIYAVQNKNEVKGMNPLEKKYQSIINAYKEIGMSFIYDYDDIENVNPTIFVDDMELLVNKEFINNNLDNQISFDKMNIKLVVKNKEEE